MTANDRAVSHLSAFDTLILMVPYTLYVRHNLGFLMQALAYEPWAVAQNRKPVMMEIGRTTYRAVGENKLG